MIDSAQGQTTSILSQNKSNSAILSLLGAFLRNP